MGRVMASGRDEVEVLLPARRSLTVNAGMGITAYLRKPEWRERAVRAAIFGLIIGLACAAVGALGSEWLGELLASVVADTKLWKKLPPEAAAELAAR